ncbi:MAG TPA: hypothetical protein VF739_13545 [Ktedonobacterales bacterium]|jgi:hypothetical protein
MTEPEHVDRCEECGTRLYQAGEIAPSGAYLRVDNDSFQRVTTSPNGTLPASFDGHIALYRSAASPCHCERCHFGRLPVEEMVERVASAEG